jgi:hypothetical protein
MVWLDRFVIRTLKLRPAKHRAINRIRFVAR